MLKSAISATLFDDFSSSYQSYNANSDRPFVYVDPDGNIKLLTNMVSLEGQNDGIFAVSMAEDGWMEYLALQE